jgi:hypothetical protein
MSCSGSQCRASASLPVHGVFKTPFSAPVGKGRCVPRNVSKGKEGANLTSGVVRPCRVTRLKVLLGGTLLRFFSFFVASVNLSLIQIATVFL